jgi:hypothetical protein
MRFIDLILSNKGWIFSGIGVLAGLFSFAFHHYQRAKDKAEKRVSGFVESFRNLYKHKDDGRKLEVLVPAGIASLKNDKEIRMAFGSLMKIIPKHPLRTWEDRVEKVGYKRFFDYVATSDRELNKETIEGFLGHFESFSNRAS